MKIGCQFCKGDGYFLETEHARGCNEMGCASNCPVQIQVPCQNCNGQGYFEVPDTEGLSHER